MLRPRAGEVRGEDGAPGEGDRGLPTREWGTRELRPAGPERRDAPGRSRRPRPGSSLDARLVQPLLHRTPSQSRPGEMAVAVPGRLLREARPGGGPRLARAARRERAPARRARRRSRRRALALPPRRRAPDLRDGGRPGGGRGRSRGRSRPGGPRRRDDGGGGSTTLPQPSVRPRRRLPVPGGRPPRSAAVHAGRRRAGCGRRRDGRDRRGGALARAGGPKESAS